MSAVELSRENPLNKKLDSWALSLTVIHRITIDTFEKDQLINLVAIHVHKDGRRNQSRSTFSTFTEDRMVELLMSEEQKGFAIKHVNGVPFAGTYEDLMIVLLESAKSDREAYIKAMKDKFPNRFVKRAPTPEVAHA